MSARKSILFIPLDFSEWPSARHWSYSITYGIEEGLEASGIDFLTVPVIRHEPRRPRARWLRHLQQMTEGRRFDQVWLELVHSAHENDFLEWLAAVAPVRLGMLGESLDYSAEECAAIPGLVDRRRMVEEKLDYVTHVLACDERDAERLNAAGSVSAMWWPPSVGERYFAYRGAVKCHRPAGFCGAIYGARADWLHSDALKGLMTRIFPPPENFTLYTIAFNAIQKANERALCKGGKGYIRFHDNVYLPILRYVRRSIFVHWLRALKSGCAVVNLPHYVKTYASRVVEAMSVGCPVISWDVTDRPRNRALFEEGKEILLFGKDNVEMLAEHIRRLMKEPSYAARLADGAADKVRRFHTTERRVAQILDWIESGKEPELH